MSIINLKNINFLSKESTIKKLLFGLTLLASLTSFAGDQCDGAMKILEDISTQQGLNIAHMSASRAVDPQSDETIQAQEKIADYKTVILKAKDAVRFSCSN